jgi:putative transposase
VHLLELARYVVLNPKRGGLCRHPRQWRWSSYRATVGIDAAPTFLASDDLLSHFGTTRASARKTFVAFVSDALAAPPRAAA